LLDLVAQLDLDLFDHPSLARGDLHGRLVGLHGDERLLYLHRVAHFDQQLNDGDLVEIADVGNGYLYRCHV
jgi:hypothetical protein